MLYFVVNTKNGQKLGPYEQVQAKQVLWSKNDQEHREYTYTGPKRGTRATWVLQTQSQVHNVPGMWIKLGDLISLRSK
jgi:hypothetical protein